MRSAGCLFLSISNVAAAPWARNSAASWVEYLDGLQSDRAGRVFGHGFEPPFVMYWKRQNRKYEIACMAHVCAVWAFAEKTGNRMGALGTFRCAYEDAGYCLLALVHGMFSNEQINLVASFHRQRQGSVLFPYISLRRRSLPYPFHINRFANPWMQGWLGSSSRKRSPVFQNYQ